MNFPRIVCGAGLIACCSATATPVWADADPSAAAAAPATFAILEYRVLGNSVLPVRTVERAVYSHLGPTRSLSDAQAARTDLEKAYRDAGYSSVYVDIPEQSVDSGVVRLQVTEGRIERVRVTGMRYFSDRRVIAAVPSLQTGAVPYFPAVQQLGQLNGQTPDLKVAPVLRPGSQPGTVDVDLKANDTLPLHGSVEVNNRYTAGTTHTRLYFNLAYANLFQSDQSLALQYQMAPERTKDSGVLAATYGIPLGPSGASLSLIGVQTDSNIATLGTLGVLGRGHIYGMHYNLPVAAASGFSAALTFGGDYKDFDQNVLLAGGGGLETPVRYINWSAVLAGALTRPKMTATFDVDFDFGIRGLENLPAEFENNRYLARANYSYLRLNANADHALIWGSRFALRVSTQYATEPLLNTEQFAIGGVESVRGYLEAEELGDLGASGSAELRTATLTTLLGRPVQQAYAFLFTDAGIVGTISPLPQQEARTSLRSWGIGVRIAGLSGFDTAFDWAYPLLTSPEVKAGDSRFEFRFRYGF